MATGLVGAAKQAVHDVSQRDVHHLVLQRGPARDGGAVCNVRPFDGRSIPGMVSVARRHSVPPAHTPSRVLTLQGQSPKRLLNKV